MVVRAAAVAVLHVRAVSVLVQAHLAQALRVLAQHRAPAAMVNVAATAAAKAVAQARVKGVQHVRRAQPMRANVVQTRLTQGVVNRQANNRSG